MLGVLVTAYFFWPNPPPPAEMEIDINSNPSALPKTSKVAKGPIILEPLDVPQEDTKKINTSKAESAARLEDIADSYAATLKYPHYSSPLTQQDYSLLNPYSFTASARQFPNSSDISYQIELPRFVFFHGQSIPTTVRIMNTGKNPLPQIVSVIAEIWEYKTMRDSVTIPVQYQDGKTASYFLDYLPPEAESLNWGSELGWRIKILANGVEEMISMTYFRYMQSVSKIIEVQARRIEGPHMIIPVRLEVKANARFQVTANLFSRHENKPLSHLQMIQPLQAPEGILELKVHQSVLKELGDSGPYQLRDIWIYQMSDVIGVENKMGNAQNQAYEIAEIDLSQLSDEPHMDPDEQEKLQRFREFVNDQKKHERKSNK